MLTTIGLLAALVTTSGAFHPPAGGGPRIEAIAAPIPAARDDRPAWASAGVPDTVWKLAEAGWTAMDAEAGRRLLAAGERHARLAVDEEPQSLDRRFALAVVLGMRAEREGGRAKVRAAAELHRQLVAVLERDPHHAGARHLLGRLHVGVRQMNTVTRFLATNLLGGGALAGASWEEAERHLAFAERRAPEVSDHHLQLARLYLDTDRPGLALREIEHVLRIEPLSPMERVVRSEAIALRRGLRGEG